MTTRRQLSSSQTVIRVSPSAQPGLVQPSLRRPRERILVGGDTVTGKTYAYLRMALNSLRKSKEQGTYPSKFFVLDTDDKLSKYMPTVYDLWEAGHDLRDPQIQKDLWDLVDSGANDFSVLYCGVGGNLYPYPSLTWNESSAATASILASCTREDWVVIDVVNRIYEQAQNLWAAAKQHSTVEDRLIQARLENPKSQEASFGGFDPGDWNTIQRIHNTIINPLYLGSQANLLFLSHIRAVNEHQETREGLLLFDAIGMEPNCANALKSLMDTIVILWSRYRIPRDERKRRVGSAYVERFMTIPKDHGRAYMTTHRFGEDFWEDFQAARRVRNYPQNIKTAEEAAGMEPYRDTLGREMAEGDSIDEAVLPESETLIMKEAPPSNNSNNSNKPRLVLRKP